MNQEFLEAYTTALNRSVEIMEKMQSKGVLIEGVDDQLLKDFNESQAVLKKFDTQITEMNRSGLL